MVQRFRMVRYPTKKILSKLGNIFANITTIKTPESSGNVPDKSSRDAGNNVERKVAIVHCSYETLLYYCEEVCGKRNGPEHPTLPSDRNFTGKVGMSTIPSICQRATRFFRL